MGDFIMKLIESISGTGSVVTNGERIKGLDYELNVYQDNAMGEDGLKQISGRIPADDALLFFDRDNLQLVLEDGRTIEFFVKNTSGEIRCSGGFVDPN